MESTILHLAIDSFPIQAERLRCPKLVGRPVALVPPDSPRPRVVLVSREARAAGIRPGAPVLVARRLCRDLIALPPDPDLYAGLAHSIRERLAPFAPFADDEARFAPSAGRFALDLTGVTRSHTAAKDRAAAAGREIEARFRLHPTLGIAATRLVSRVAATVLAPDGELLDVLPGAELPFLAPLPVHLLPAARDRFVAERLDLLNVRLVRDLQWLAIEPLRAAFGRAAAGALWREARGLDPSPASAARRVLVPARVLAAAEETLGEETNDGRVLAARLSRLVLELGFGLRARGAEACGIEVRVWYADGREGRARRGIGQPTNEPGALREAALTLIDRARGRRVRVSRLRIEAWEAPARPRQLALWPPNESARGGGAPDRHGAADGDGAAPGRTARLDLALDRVRGRFGTSAVVPAAWMAYGLVRTPARP